MRARFVRPSERPTALARVARLGTAPALVLVVAIAVAVLAKSVRAQDGGAGASGVSLLQLPAGSRAAAFSGAYTALTGDPAVLFYNPAGTAGLDAAAGLSYQRYVADIALGSGSGAVLVGPVVVGAGVLFLDAGEIAVVEPDPSFGGQRGQETGAIAGASESAALLGAALPLLDGRVRVGATAGFVSTELAGLSRGAPIFGLGAQAVVPHLPFITLGASLRNLGGSLSGDGEDIPLPSEARLGAAVEYANARGLGAVFAADVVSRLEDDITQVVFGVETGLLPDHGSRYSAVGRIGYAGEGEDGLGAWRFGAGLAVAELAFDYTYQNLEFFGSIHRIGVRWVRNQ